MTFNDGHVICMFAQGHQNLIKQAYKKHLLFKKLICSLCVTYTKSLFDGYSITLLTSDGWGQITQPYPDVSHIKYNQD